MIFINLTTTNDEPITVNLDHVVDIQPISEEDTSFAMSLADRMKKLFEEDDDDDDPVTDALSKSTDHVINKLQRANCMIMVDIPDSKSRSLYVKESYVEVLEKIKYFSDIHIN